MEITLEIPDDMIERVRACGSDDDPLSDVILDLLWVGVLIHDSRLGAKP